MNPPEPPLASPFGGALDASLPLDGVSISYGSMLSWGMNARMTAKVMCVTPVCVLFEIVALPGLPVMFLAALLLNYLILKPRGRATTVLNRQGLHERAKSFPFSIGWGRFLWVLEWGGDVLCVTFGGGCFVPREAFASQGEAREFAAIARQLKATKGQGWRDEWNGRVFGVQASDRNNPL